MVEGTKVAGMITAKGDVSVLATGNASGATALAKNGDIFVTGATIESTNGHVSLRVD